MSNRRLAAVSVRDSVRAAMKAPLILLPGLLCDEALWAAQRAALADIAESCVADLTKDDSLASMAMRVLAAAPSRFALAGLSMGGYLAFEVLRRAPERVERLALLDTSARPDSPKRRQARRDLIALAEKGEFKGVSPKLLPQWIHPSRLADTALTQAVVDMAARVGRDAFVRQQTAILDRPDSRPGLSAISCPTLVLCGREDLATPLDLHREIASDIPGARLVVVETCGHLATLERPDAVNRALRDWLGREPINLPG